MRNPIIEKLLAKTRRTDLPKFGPGDTIKVLVKIREGEKERLQAFEGVVIAQSRGANLYYWRGLKGKAARRKEVKKARYPLLCFYGREGVLPRPREGAIARR